MRSRFHVADLHGVVAVETLEDGRVRVDLADGRSLAVRLRRLERPAPTPLTCKGDEGKRYPEFVVLGLDPVRHP